MSNARNREVGQWAVSLASGVLFGFGLALSGMTRPEKVRGFLDFFRAWDPSLMFVMGGAVLVHTIAYRIITRLSSPIFAAKFGIPTRKDLDARLLVGAAVFGAGWGLGGFCPGPGITSITTGAPAVLAFVVAMLVGTFVTARLEDARRPALETPKPAGGR